MMVENIEDHMALACDCGSVNWAYLRSGKIECHACGTVKDIGNQDSTKTLMDVIVEKDKQLAQLTSGWSQYLKDDETPLQRIEREIADCQSALSLLAESRTQLAEAQAKLQETCLQVAGAVWATAAPDKVVDIQTCVDIVKKIMQEQTK